MYVCGCSRELQVERMTSVNLESVGVHVRARNGQSSFAILSKIQAPSRSKVKRASGGNGL